MTDDNSSKTAPAGLYEMAARKVAEERGIDPNTLPSLKPPEHKAPLLEGFPGVINSIGSGIVEAGFQTKDFLFGESAEEDKSWFRRAHEGVTEELTRDSTINSLTQGVSQFATGMLGAGKLLGPIKAAQGLKAAGKAGRFAYETGRGAIAGAVVIDPHEERLSDLIEAFPALQNPVTDFLAADPSDSAATGRLKNALEGIGVDLALAGVFAASVKALKLAKGGDHAAAAKELAKIETPEAAYAKAEPTDLPPSGTTGASPPEPSPVAKGGEAEAANAAAPSSLPETAPRSAQEAPTTPSSASTPPEQPKGETPLGESPKAATASDPLPEASMGAIMDSARNDYAALRAYGSREEAIAQGYRFADGARLPWQKLRASEEVRTFVDAAAERLKTRIDTAKGSDILSDAHVREMVEERAALFGEEPADILGRLAQSGESARTMAADMEASFLIANKMLQDAYDVAAKVRTGMLDDWAGDAVKAGDELKSRMAAASELLGSAMSMRAASGRALRRMRGRFQITPADIEHIKELDAGKLAEILYATKGNPKMLAEAANPSLLKRAIGEANFSLTNSLLWLYPTHTVNLSTNLYMLAARPTEKLVGSFTLGAKGSAVRAQALKEYRYTLASLGDGWAAMLEAFQRGDSTLAPHMDEYLAEGHQALRWKPVKGVGDLLENGWRAVNYRTIVGLPTRSLGAVDEFMKTLRYRAVVQASAAVDAQARGLEGDALRAFVVRRLAAAFDENGRGIDRAALQEAQTATFQQELLSGTVGATLQHARRSHPSLGLVFPFVKTPVNVLRYAWKMTPGLSLLQTEYRAMLRGAKGAEAQAHAIGQLVLGASFAGIAAALAAEGRLTGSGPEDPKLLSALRATGWQPYSIVWTGEDGKRRYFPLGRFDPVGMPMGMVADLVDAQRLHPGSKEAEKGALATVLALAANFSDRTFLRNANSLLRAATEPETHLGKFAGQTAGNAIPLSSLLRGTNPDPYMRDARGFVDNLLRGLPGYSETLPPRRDSFGEPIWSRIGLSTTEEADVVEAEHNRIIIETGEGIRPPTPNRRELDLRDVTLSDGRNAYDLLQELSANPRPGKQGLKAALAKLIQSDAYQKLVDGDPSLKGTKLGAIADVVGKYREAALKIMLAKYPELRKELLKKQIDVKQAVEANRKAGSKPGDAERLLKRLGY